MKLTREMFRRQWPEGDGAMIDGILATQDAVFTRFEINNALRVAHFMAQISVECAYGTRFEENLNYKSASRIKAVFPKYFRTLDAAAACVRSPAKLANIVYGGRFGNRPNTDDGFAFRGRGLLQLTFRDNYATIGAIAGVPIGAHPDLAVDPKYALLVAGGYWHHAHCNAAADTDVVEMVTKRVNGGTHGLHDRIDATKRWKEELVV